MTAPLTILALAILAEIIRQGWKWWHDPNINDGEF